MEQVEIVNAIVLMNDNNGNGYAIMLDKEDAQIITAFVSKLKEALPIEPTTVDIIVKKNDIQVKRISTEGIR